MQSLPDLNQLSHSEKDELILVLCAVLMDDNAGRRMAKNFGVTSIGIMGVLVLAKQKELLPAIKPLLDQLTASGYLLGDKPIASALAMVGEEGLGGLCLRLPASPRHALQTLADSYF